MGIREGTTNFKTNLEKLSNSGKGLFEYFNFGAETVAEAFSSCDGLSQQLSRIQDEKEAKLAEFDQEETKERNDLQSMISRTESSRETDPEYERLMEKKQILKEELAKDLDSYERECDEKKIEISQKESREEDRLNDKRQNILDHIENAPDCIKLKKEKEELEFKLENYKREYLQGDYSDLEEITNNAESASKPWEDIRQWRPEISDAERRRLHSLAMSLMENASPGREGGKALDDICQFSYENAQGKWKKSQDREGFLQTAAKLTEAEKRNMRRQTGNIRS